MKKESYLFVTYCDSDYEHVDNIFLELYKQNIPVKSAKDVEQSNLSTLIENAAAVLVVLSPSALNSETLRQHIELAEKSDKHLIPYFLCVPDALDLPGELCMLLNGAAAIPAYEYDNEKNLSARALAELRPYFPDESELKKKAKKARNRTIVSTVFVVLAILFILGSLSEEPEPQTETEPQIKTEAQTETEPQTKDETPPYNSSELFAHLRQSTVFILTTDEDIVTLATGSGFFFNSDGMIATNYHVLEGGTNFFIRPSTDDNYYTATVISTDEQNDLAILQIDSVYTTTAYLTFSDKKIEIGEPVYVSGYPKGIDLTISDGIISNDKHISPFTQEEYFTITAAASSGNSGGPVINSSGEVIGVLTAKYTEAENMNLVKPVSYLKDLIENR